ncbi:MAG: hypothetical protein Q4P13_08635 [Psychrobacter sp.]|nr:hypothetical protein [Psychrobacter sp.]
MLETQPEFNLKPLKIYGGWHIHFNHFSNLEPDNDYPKEDVCLCFTEDISYFTYGDERSKKCGMPSYFIDLGFTEGLYLNGKKGFFQLVVAQGDFIKGIVYEYFISRSTDEIQDKINTYIQLISTGKITKYKGLTFDGEAIEGFAYNDFLFSATEGIKERFHRERYF